jgi:hypothetical protein
VIRQLSVKGGAPPRPVTPRPGKRRPRLGMRVGCYSRGVRATVVGRDLARVLRVTFWARGTTHVDRRRPFRRSVRLRPRARARGIRVRARAVLRGGGTVSFSRRVACRRAEPS